MVWSNEPLNGQRAPERHSPTHTPSLTGLPGGEDPLTGYATTDDTATITTAATALAARVTTAETNITALQASRTRNFFIQVKPAEVVAGSPVFTVQGGGYYTAFAFDAAAASESLQYECVIPSDYVSGLAIRLHWTNLGAGAGNVVWGITTSWAATTENMDTPAHTASANSTIAAPSQHVLKISTHSVTPTPAAGNAFFFFISRLGSNVADTLANDAGLVALEFTYTASAT